MLEQKLYWGRLRQFGALYNYHAVSNANFAPSGWRLPTATDITNLRSAIASNAQRLKDSGYWAIGSSGIGLDTYGFRGIPSSFRDRYGGFGSEFTQMLWWTSTLYITDYRYAARLWYNNESLDTIERHIREGLSVRFIKNDGIMPTAEQVVDFEGGAYPVVRLVDGVNVYIWTALNWRSRFYFDGSVIQLVESASSWETESPYAPGTGMMCYYNNMEQFR
jgi:uncharacterized protein (TIGR02145 family)